MSYELRIVSPAPIDLGAVRRLLLASDGVEAVGDDLIWAGETVSAAFVLDQTEIGVGVTSAEAAPADLRREFSALLDVVSRVAALVGAPVYDVQLGRTLAPDDDEAVRDFAG